MVQSANNPTTFTTLSGQTAGKLQTADAAGLVITQDALVYVWDNSAGSGDWFNPLNWNLDNGVPGAADTAILNIASTINLLPSTSVGTFQQSAGTLGGAGTLTVLTSFGWSGGSVDGALRNEGAATLTALSYLGGKLENAGVFTHTSGLLAFKGGATFKNLPGATYVVETGTQGLFENHNGSTGNLFQNEGLLRRDGVGIASFDPVPLLNKASGEIEVLNGTLRLNTTGTIEGGFFDVRAGAMVSLDGTALALTGTISGSGPGIVRLDNGSLTASGAGPC